MKIQPTPHDSFVIWTSWPGLDLVDRVGVTQEAWLQPRSLVASANYWATPAIFHFEKLAVALA